MTIPKMGYNGTMAHYMNEDPYLGKTICILHGFAVQVGAAFCNSSVTQLWS